MKYLKIFVIVIIFGIIGNCGFVNTVMAIEASELDEFTDAEDANIIENDRETEEKTSEIVQFSDGSEMQNNVNREQDNNYFTVYYHLDINAKVDERSTIVTYGVTTPTLTLEELGYNKENEFFLGWRIYRECDDKWYLSDNSGNREWVQLENGELPEGYNYVLNGDGAAVAKTAPTGNVHFYAQWRKAVYTIYYHIDEESEASNKITNISYGVETRIESINELGWKKKGYVFKGWKAYRDMDDSWLATDVEGNLKWISLIDGSLPEGYDYALYDDAVNVSKTTKYGEVHLYGQWISNYINITDSLFGADGTDMEDDWHTIQKALNMARNNCEEITVYIPEGDYYISNTLTVYSNTTIILDDNARILRMNRKLAMLISEQNTQVGGYEQFKNITIQGGVWDGNIKDTSEISASLMRFYHGNNLNISNTTIANACGRHMMIIAGVNYANIMDVHFSNVVQYTGMDTDGSYYGVVDENGNVNISASLRTQEALHLDCISADGVSEPEAYPLDNTVNQNIIVSKCVFDNVMSGVGSHYVTEGVLGKDLNITQNVFVNVRYTCIDLYNQNNAVITENSADGVGEFIRASNSSGIISKNQVKIHSSNENDKKLELYGILLLNNSDIKIEYNEICNSLSIGINVQLSKAVISNNTIEDAKKHGIACYNLSNISCLSNTIESAKGHGIYANESVAEIKENIVNNSLECGVWVDDNCNSDIIANSILKSGKIGINVKNSMVNILDNTVKYSNTVGIRLYNIKGTDSNIVECTNNNVIETAGIGIQLDQSSYLKAEKNIIIDSETHGIQANLSINVELISNQITRSLVQGIFLYYSTNCIVRDNQVCDVQKHGIGVYNSKEISVLENVIKDSGQRDICANDFSEGYAKGNHISASGAWTYDNCKFILYDNYYSILVCTIYDVEKQRYTGKKIEPDFKIVNGSQELKKGIDYTISYENNINIGTAKAIIEGMGYYSGKVIKEFIISEDGNSFYVKYHSSDTAAESGKTTKVEYGTATPTLKVSELGYKKSGYVFAGWKVYREVDDKWYARTSSGTGEWVSLDADGKLPEGYTYWINGDGVSVARTAPSGNVHFYAQWRTGTYTVKYHSSDTAGESGKTTKVEYGTATPTLKVSELGYKKSGYV